MSVIETLKNKKKKYELKKDYFYMLIFFTIISGIGLLMLFNVSFTDVFVWNIKDAINSIDYGLGGFFHRIFYSIKKVIKAFKLYSILGLDGTKDYLFSSLHNIWGRDKLFYLSKSFLAKHHNIEEARRIAGEYFRVFILFFILFVLISGYFFKTKIAKIIPTKIKKFFYTFIFNNFMFPRLSESDLKNFNIDKGEIFDALEENFFNQEIILIDGYQKTEKLKYLDKFPQVFSAGLKKGEIDTKKYINEFYYIFQCFKSIYDMEDLMKIIEGYLLDNKGKPFLFDEYIENMNYDEYKKFKAFNGKDKVYFSLIPIIFFLDEESENFKKIIKKRFFQSRSYIAVQLIKYKNLLWKDRERVTKMLFGVNNNKTKLEVPFENEYQEMLTLAQKNRKEEWWKKFSERLLINLVAQFRFIVIREILGQYTNIPAGTIVSKLDDYTMRMIIDSYRTGGVIDIKTNVNDGGSKSFENDILVNLFLYAFNYYNKLEDENGEKYDVIKKIKNIWNTDIESISEAQNEIENFGSTFNFSGYSQEVKEVYRKKAIEEMSKQGDENE